MWHVNLDQLECVTAMESEHELDDPVGHKDDAKHSLVQ